MMLLSRINKNIFYLIIPKRYRKKHEKELEKFICNRKENVPISVCKITEGYTDEVSIAPGYKILIEEITQKERKKGFEFKTHDFYLIVTDPLSDNTLFVKNTRRSGKD